MNTVTNLRKLADYIEQHVTQKQLAMFDYRSHKELSTGFKSKNDCGTCGCALGWAPFVEGLEPKEEDFTTYYTNRTDTLDFDLYSMRIFPAMIPHTTDWLHVFDGGLSSEKAKVIQRLRDKANYLEKRL